MISLKNLLRESFNESDAVPPEVKQKSDYQTFGKYYSGDEYLGRVKDGQWIPANQDADANFIDTGSGMQVDPRNDPHKKKAPPEQTSSPSQDPQKSSGNLSVSDIMAKKGRVAVDVPRETAMDMAKVFFVKSQFSKDDNMGAGGGGRDIHGYGLMGRAVLSMAGLRDSEIDEIEDSVESEFRFNRDGF
jgi:hypothetical protein